MNDLFVLSCLDRLRRSMVGDPRWLLTSWGSHRPPSNHVVYADLVDFEETVETIRLPAWVPTWRVPVPVRLTAAPQPFSPLVDDMRIRNFDQWGTFATMTIPVEELWQAGLEWPHDDRFVAHLTLLRYVERS